ncbi:MAG TPA: DUF3604 domain-containing protein [Deltaproteobacteria bacterium]|nr:DUF3604 domain-containing protein [Deltaproteobacteria bacterium]
MASRSIGLVLGLGLSIGLMQPGCSRNDEGPEAIRNGFTRSAVVEETPRPPNRRQVYFGDLHVHSSRSIDAYAAGVRAGPEEAYRYARGEAIEHVSGTKIQLSGPPLDFMALTDHAEYLGVVEATEEPVHPLHALPLFRDWMGSDPGRSEQAWQQIARSFRLQRALPGLASPEIVRSGWRELVDLANRHDEPGRFTAFIGFEYSSNPDAQNLHRNVLFRGDRVPDRPFSAMDSPDPEDLWRWMDRMRTRGDDLLAIPHNPNGSNGLMFAETRFDGTPIDGPWVEQRLRNEPVVEVIQIKGQSETRPVLSPDDEWADFEVTPWLTGAPHRPSRPRGSYVRDALERGLAIEERLGRNPFVLGMIGSTDGHNASSPHEERNYSGKIGTSDGTPRARLGWKSRSGSRVRETSLEGAPSPTVSLHWSAAGLAGIWADANTRADLFDALRRREVFATSGPRIRLRFFAGWDLHPDDLGARMSIAGYARGVAMGGRLRRQGLPDGSVAPTFLISALKDPLEADLERIQIIKGWRRNGESRERVYDVACADGTPPGPTTHRCRHAARRPDPLLCKPDPEGGTPEFNVWWQDPDFDPTDRAFYYVRVLQVPTCRWSTWDAKRLDVPPPKGVPATIQERAISSPIWIGGMEPTVRPGRPD